MGDGNEIGNYAVVHTSTCITGNKKKIGDALYVGTGAKITSGLYFGNNVSIAANSVVTKSFPSENDIILVGSPAMIKGQRDAWYLCDGEKYRERVNECEKLKRKLGIYSV